MDHMSRYVKPISFFIVLLWFVAKTQAHNKKVSAVYVFGDSTVDPGNNNYIATVFKANFLPYGQDFPNKKATGRFSNGRLVTDFIASYVRVKENVPAYLEPNLSIKEMLTGVSFASAGTGFDPMTSHFSNVLPMAKQVEYFKDYKRKIATKIGKVQAEKHIKKAIFVLSAGANDFVINYFTVPIRRQHYNISSYQNFVLQNEKTFLQSLWAEGARTILVVGLPPMGCLPVMLTLHNFINPRRCQEKYSIVGKNYNNLLSHELASMQTRLASSGAQIVFVDTFELASRIIQNPSKYGFDKVYEGCCGTGLFEASYLCNPLSPLCENPSKYLFFDSIHPTETAYKMLFETGVRPILDRILKA